MDFLRLVIIEKCEVKEGSGPSKLWTFSTMAARVDILGNSFGKWAAQHFCFSQSADHFEYKKLTSEALVCSTR